jgi:short-subunit dehydrogenase
MTKAAMPLIRASKGSIVFISSVAGLKGLPGAAAYSASKMVLKSFSESLRCELMREGVHVGLIYLGFTQNDPDKRFYRENGELTVLRPAKYSLTQSQVAAALLRMVTRRQRHRVLSLLGKTARIVYVLFPRISDLALAIGTYRSKMYKT